jgi:N-acetylneuraminic acid mutarotase
LAESQGGMIGNDMILFSGFTRSFKNVTDRMMAFDTSLTTTTAVWRELDPFPVTIGLTHAGYVFHNNHLYTCGGYVGGNPYPATDLCFMYTHTNPKGRQWQSLPRLPGVRAGGAMVYDTKRHSLIFATGADRHNTVDIRTIVDHYDVWELNLNNTSRGWIAKAPIPYRANHVGHTTINYKNEGELHYVLGGQVGANEKSGNLGFMYAYNSTSNAWTRLQNLPVPRGHFSSSVVPYKNCGFFIVGGAINNSTKVSDITYYSIAHDSWTKVGDIPFPRNTPVCTISLGYFYCQTGQIRFPLSVRRKVV